MWARWGRGLARKVKAPFGGGLGNSRVSNFRVPRDSGWSKGEDSKDSGSGDSQGVAGQNLFQGIGAPLGPAHWGKAGAKEFLGPGEEGFGFRPQKGFNTRDLGPKGTFGRAIFKALGGFTKKGGKAFGGLHKRSGPFGDLGPGPYPRDTFLPAGPGGSYKKLWFLPRKGHGTP